MSKSQFKKRRQDREHQKKKAYQKSRGLRERKSRLLIVCEGEKTEISYFREMISTHRLPTANITIINDGSAPISVVNGAIKRLKEDSDFDRVYCVFDRDEHASFDQAIRKAKEYRGVEIIPIVSNRQFEFWFILHFSDSTKAYSSSKDIEKALEKLIQKEGVSGFKYSKNKSGMYDLTRNNIKSAIERSKRIIEMAQKNGDLEYSNPSTLVHIVVEDLLKLIE